GGLGPLYGANAAGVSAQPPPRAVPSSALLTITGFGSSDTSSSDNANWVCLAVAWNRPAGSRVGPPSRARPIPILAACSLFWRLAPADPLAPGLDASLYVAAAHCFSAAELQRSGSSPILSAIAC